jgi:cytochrome d ubiquinol oxidase subunit I
MTVGSITAILQPISGDLIAKFVHRTQPAKFAAMESHFETSTYAPALIGGIPDVNTRQVRWGIEVPGVLSFLATGNPSAKVKGLNDIDPSLWPNVALVHLSFQVMVGLGVLMMLVAVWFGISAWRRRERAFDGKWLLRAIVLCGPAGFVALEAGWIVTECGRQPWVINGIMKTADGVTPYPNVWPTFIGFTALYMVLAITTIALLRYLARKPKPQAGGYE